jgi:hypothetical protein
LDDDLATPARPQSALEHVPEQQYEWLKQAIANWRTLQETLRQMQRLSREKLFTSLPNPKRRKQLSKKVLGLV